MRPARRFWARATDHDGVVAAEASYPSNLVRLVYDPEEVDEADLSGLLDGAGYRARHVDEAGEDDTTETVGRLVIGGFFGMMTMAWYVLFLYPTYLGVERGRVQIKPAVIFCCI